MKRGPRPRDAPAGGRIRRGAAGRAGRAAATFRYAHVGDVNTLDPYQFDETVQLGFLGNIYEPLVGREHPRDEARASPCDALGSWSSPPAGGSHLRRGVKFHNGNRLLTA